MRRTLRIGEVIESAQGDLSRISCVVDGMEVWFESTDVSLSASPEAVASAFWIPCLRSGIQLEIEQPVCATWKSNVEQLAAIVSRNWAVPAARILAPAATPGTAGITKPAPRSPATAQFFTGGVDSFYVLLRCEPRAEYLVYVHGFDIPLADAARFEHAHRSLLEVAKATGTRLCVVRTNLRHHPVLNSISWEDSHGGSLVAAAHAMVSHIGAITIPPSWPAWMNKPWGTHWELDPLWSSSLLEVKHGDASLYRSDRLRAIADERVVQEHLRVCWENRKPVGNCSECEKCIRAMVVLQQSGRLERYSSVFDVSIPVWQRIDRLPYVRTMMAFEECLRRNVEPELAAAIKRLRRRSFVKHTVPKFRGQLMERAKRPIRRWAGRLRTATHPRWSSGEL
jgi:hypothetical protein